MHGPNFLRGGNKGGAFELGDARSRSKTGQPKSAEPGGSSRMALKNNVEGLRETLRWVRGKRRPSNKDCEKVAGEGNGGRTGSGILR